MAASSSSLMASQTLIHTNPNFFLSPLNPTTLSLSFPRNHLLLRLCLSKPRRTIALLSPSPKHPLNLSLRRPKSELFATSSSSAAIPTENPPNPTYSALTGSTRTLTTIFAFTLTLSKLLASKICLLSLKLGGIVQNPINNPQRLATAVGPLFFAAISEGAPSSMSRPIAVLVGGLSRWLEIYSCVLLVRVLLSWFPNISWDKQPMSAIRDLCDPYLSLFRGIIPPLFNSLDVSPILAFLLLGMLGQFVRTPRS